MAGLFELKFEKEFSTSDTILVTHNANNDFLKVRLIVNSKARPDLVADIKPTIINPRNELTVILTSVQTGKIQIIEMDVISANELPSSQPFEAGSILIALFASTANNVSNKFLDTDNIAASNVLPAPVVADGLIQRVSFTGTSLNGSGITGTLEIRINGSLEISESLVDLQSQIFDVSVPVLRGDQLTCKIGSGSSNIAKPLVKVYQ